MKIEGKNAILEALRAGKTIESLLAEKGATHEIIAKARKAGAKVQFTDKAVLDKLSPSGGRHQGFIAEISEYKYFELDELLTLRAANGRRLLVLLDGVCDPHNLGSVIRACECAGATGVVITKNRSAAVTETVIRTSAGAAMHMPVAKVTNLSDAIEKIKQSGIWVYCADMDGASAYQTDLSDDIALVVGGEGFGVGRLVRERADGIVSLPMLGQINSLNASVACGIVLYEAVRQFLNKQK